MVTARVQPVGSKPHWRGRGGGNAVLLPDQRQQMEVTTMKRPVKRLLFWAPRILCILFAVFVSLFALDVFGEGYGFWGTMLALLMHLVPTGVILIVLAISWRWEWVGGILFTALGVLYLVMFWGRFHWSAYLLISGPLLLVGILFLINWLYRARLRTQRRDHEAQA